MNWFDYSHTGLQNLFAGVCGIVVLTLLLFCFACPQISDRHIVAESCFSFEHYTAVTNECTAACTNDAQCARLDALYQAKLDKVPAAKVPSSVFAEGLSHTKTYLTANNSGDIALYDITSSGNLALRSVGVLATTTDPILRDPQLHLHMWQAFTDIFPRAYQYADLLTRFELYTDGVGGEDASAGQTENPNQWLLSLDPADVLDTDGRFSPTKDFYHTLIHEYGHILTLNPTQVPPQPESASSSCTTFFTGEGCATTQSYIAAYFDHYWRGDVYESYNKAINSCDTSADECVPQEDWYESRKTMFVTDYAAMDPSEDIAESWAIFVLQPKPTGSTIADEKVLFFYKYPELVTLRNVVRARLARQAS